MAIYRLLDNNRMHLAQGSKTKLYGYIAREAAHDPRIFIGAIWQEWDAGQWWTLHPVKIPQEVAAA